MATNLSSLTIILTLLGALIPSMVIGASLPDGLFTGKELVIILWSILVSVCTVTNMAFRPNELFKFEIIDFLVFIYLIYRAVHAGIFSPMDGLPMSAMLYISYLCFYIAIRLNKLADNRSTANSFFILIFSFLNLQVILGVVQFLGIMPSMHDSFPITGAFFNPGPYAILLSMLLTGTLYQTYLWLKTCSMSYFRGYVILVQFSSLILIAICQSRAAIIGLVGTISILFFIEKRIILRRYWAMCFLCVSLISICGGIFLFNLKPTSALGRTWIWKVSGRVINEHPLIGVGEGNFPYHFLNEQMAFFSEDTTHVKSYGSLAGEIAYTFNDTLQIIAEVGIIGGVLYYTVFLMVIWKLIRFVLKEHPTSDKLYPYSLLSILVCFFLCGFFAYPGSLLPFNVINIVLIALVTNNFRFVCHKRNSKFKSLRIIIPSIMIGISLQLFNYGYNNYYALRNWYNSIVLSDRQQLQILLKCYPVLKTNGYYLYYVGMTYAKNNSLNKAIYFLQKAKVLYPDKNVLLTLANVYSRVGYNHAAENEYLFLTKAFPRDIFLYRALAHYYNGHDEFIKLAALKLKVNNLRYRYNSDQFETIKAEINALGQEKDTHSLSK